MAATVASYADEKELVRDLCSVLESADSPWGEVCCAREFGYVRGRTDVIAVDRDGMIVAFEAKLGKWRDALQQAYRNTCFAHRSYVVLPTRTAQMAQRYSHEFIRRSVGLCVVEGNVLTILVAAPRQEPIQPWLSELAWSTAQLSE